MAFPQFRLKRLTAYYGVEELKELQNLSELEMVNGFFRLRRARDSSYEILLDSIRGSQLDSRTVLRDPSSLDIGVYMKVLIEFDKFTDPVFKQENDEVIALQGLVMERTQQPVDQGFCSLKIDIANFLGLDTPPPFNNNLCVDAVQPKKFYVDIGDCFSWWTTHTLRFIYNSNIPEKCWIDTYRDIFEQDPPQPETLE